jgi:hypothetical protein
LISIVFILIYSSEVGYYEATQSNPLPPHLQSCIQYKRMNCLALRPLSSTRSRPQSEIKFPQVYVRLFDRRIYNEVFFRKPKTEMKTSNNHETDVYTMQELASIHFKVCSRI